MGGAGERRARARVYVRVCVYVNASALEQVPATATREKGARRGMLYANLPYRLCRVLSAVTYARANLEGTHNYQLEKIEKPVSKAVGAKCVHTAVRACHACQPPLDTVAPPANTRALGSVCGGLPAASGARSRHGERWQRAALAASVRLLTRARPGRHHRARPRCRAGLR